MGTLRVVGALAVALLISISFDACAAEPASNAGLVSQVAARLAQAKGVRAQFTQTQTLSAMRQPLVSTGYILFVRERGVIWHIESPYQATYVITDAGVSEVSATGQRVSTNNGNGNGMRGVAQVSRMMRAMLGGDLSALYSQFNVQADGTPAQWHMQLTPAQPQIAQSIKGLQMNGGDFLQTLRIALANGDTTRIDFVNSALVNDLTPPERALFGAP
jgi:outer membrane lipoprotein-sorting protein